MTTTWAGRRRRERPAPSGCANAVPLLGRLRSRDPIRTLGPDRRRNVGEIGNRHPRPRGDFVVPAVARPDVTEGHRGLPHAANLGPRVDSHELVTLRVL